MRKLKILFFSADPHSIPPGTAPRLRLDEDIRQIREKIRMSDYRDAVEVDIRPAARIDDLLQALNEVKPHVVHFSGHGWSEGLILVGPGGWGAHGLDAAVLTKLFRKFRGRIHLVVLNACDSEKQARAVAEVVGCAIGMRGKILDPAAIAFGAAFYRAIGFRDSVEGAFDQACIALGCSPEHDRPQLAHRKGVDPKRLVLVPPPWPKRTKRMFTAAATVVFLAGGVAAWKYCHPTPPPECAWDQDGMPHLVVAGSPSPAPQSSSAPLGGSETELEIAEAQHGAGNDSAAFPHFQTAAQAGDVEAKGYLGVAYLCGEGTARQPKLGVEWLQKAAGKRDPRAMLALSFAYQHGIGVKASTHWSEYWSRTANRVRTSKAARMQDRPASPQGPSPPAGGSAGPDTAYRPPPLDDSGNLIRNGGFQDHFDQWTRTVSGSSGKGTNEVVSFADARSGYALHLAYEGRGSLQFEQKIPVTGPDYVFRATFRASSHEGRMIGFSGTGIATVMLQYLDADGRVLGMTRLFSYVENPLANTPLAGVPRRGNGGNTVHYMDVEEERLYKDYELDISREIEENLLGVVARQVRTVAITLYCGATDDGAGAELWVSDVSLRPKR